MKLADIKPGTVFRYAKPSELTKDVRFAKLNEVSQHSRVNVVNLASWTAAYVDPDTELEKVGLLGVVHNSGQGFTTTIL